MIITIGDAVKKLIETLKSQQKGEKNERNMGL